MRKWVSGASQAELDNRDVNERSALHLGQFRVRLRVRLMLKVTVGLKVRVKFQG